LHAVERDVLDPDVAEAALQLALEELTASEPVGAGRDAELRAELAKLETELARYAEAIADAGALEAIVGAIRTREQRRDVIRRELKTLLPRRRVEVDATSIAATLNSSLNDWKSVARQSIVEARRLLRTVLIDRLVLRPVPLPPDMPPPKGPGRKARLVYKFTGEAT